MHNNYKQTTCNFFEVAPPNMVRLNQIDTSVPTIVENYWNIYKRYATHKNFLTEFITDN